MFLKQLVHQSLAVLFALDDVARAAVFYRPAGFNPQTGLFAANEIAAPCTILVLGYRPFELGIIPEPANQEKLIVRTEDLAGVSAPGPGDFLVETATGQRRDVLAAQADHLGEYWLFHAQRCADEDWGDLAAAILSEDFSDLAPATASDDYGALT